MANVSGWTSSQPSGASSIRLGDDLFRSDKSILSAALNEEHYYDPVTSASSLSGGQHRKGSARVFTSARASIATPASNDSDGRLVYNTDHAALLVLTANSMVTVAHGSQPPGARGYSATTAATSGATQPLVLATEQYDFGGFFSAASHGFLVPSGAGGNYILTANARFPSLHTGTRRSLSILRGAEVIGLASCGTGETDGDLSLSVTVLDNCAAAQNYFVQVFQDSGGALSINSAYFAIQKI